MNRIEGKILEIMATEGVSLVKCEASAEKLIMIALELPTDVCTNANVQLGIKATHIMLSRKRITHSTVSNQIPVIIQNINEGNILSSVKLDFKGTLLESIVPKYALSMLNLKQGEPAFAVFQASELSIIKVEK
jgi:molybdopterin-binding protein